MTDYIHTVRYYETDKMGITHHSNYIRFLEEARMEFLRALGYPMVRIEAAGLTSPVVSLSCEYRRTTTYDDDIAIAVQISAYHGVKLTLTYALENARTHTPVAQATSTHCFLNEAGKPVALRKYLPELDEKIRAALSERI